MSIWYPAWLTNLTAAAVAALWNPATQAAEAESRLSPVYVFGGVVADLGVGWERFGPFTSPLRDCSTETFRCMSGGALKVSVPVRCSDVELDTYGSGEEQAVVLHRVADTSWQTWSRERLIGNSARPYIVFGYVPREGIQYLIFDPSRRMDLVSLAQSGELLDRLSGDLASRNLKMNLITYSQLFPCQGEF